MKGWMALPAVAIAALALTAGVMAGGMHHEGKGEGIDGFVHHALDDLEATEAQRTRVLAVTDRLTAGFGSLHGVHEAAHAAFLREWGKDAMDVAQLHGLVDAKIEELSGNLHQVVDGVAEIHDTLTPEQRRKLTARVQEMHGHP